MKKYDGEFPERFKQECLDFWGVSQSELYEELRNWTNEHLFKTDMNEIELVSPIWAQHFGLNAHTSGVQRR